jgi:hypothetical protein
MIQEVLNVGIQNPPSSHPRGLAPDVASPGLYQDCRGLWPRNRGRSPLWP